MIDSEKIHFTIRSYGKFVMDYKGLKYLGSDHELDISEAGDELAQSFNDAYASSAHLTPLEALNKIPDHFYVSPECILDVKVSDQKPIQGPTDDIIY